MNEQEIFLEALSLPLDARSVYLEHACAENPAVKGAVASLLRAYQGASLFLEDPAADPGETVAQDPTGVEVGEKVGPYKLVELISEGGMGSVYLAKQTEPVKRVVAVKVIKAGMDSKAVLARFEAERQALAMMDHPNIAKVLDAGMVGGVRGQRSEVRGRKTEVRSQKSEVSSERSDSSLTSDLCPLTSGPASGRPYFVMELVKGLTITKFCDERRLTLRQRLELFVPVCHAIQHAHQKGVIHRDIKPSNVLVALYDDRPVPKVIDFGVAKATGASLTDESLMTGFGAVVGTAEYMSPEQATLNNLDIDTRSDVYSLGVLLYELLTGTTPIDRKRLGKSTLMEILRIVREVDAPAPSAKLSTADTLPSVAANRGVEPAKLSKSMKGELDWVLLKALDKDRTRRYESASAFARDLQRYLSDEMVEARPPSVAYRVTKYVRRHKKQVIAASLLLLTLVGGVIGTTWGMVEARRATTAEVAAKKRESERADGEKSARLEAQKRLVQIEKGVDLLANIVRDLNPNNEAEGGRSVYEQLLERAEIAANGLDAQAIGDPLTLARLQLRMGETLDGLGNPKKAAVLLEKAHDAFKRIKGATDSETLSAVHAMSDAWRNVGGTKVDDAVTALMRLREERTKLLGPNHEDTFAAANSLAEAIGASGRVTKAIEVYESIRGPMMKSLGSDHPVALLTLSNLANAYHYAGRREEAVAIFEEVRRAEVKHQGPQSLRFLHAGVRLADTLQTNGDLDAAIRTYEEVVDPLRTRWPHHVSTFEAMNSMASAYSAAARLDKSIPLLEDLLRRTEAKSGRRDYHTQIAMISLGANYLEAGRVDEATKLLEEAFGATRDHLLRRRSGAELAQAYAKGGRSRDTRVLVEKLAYEVRRDFEKDHLQRAFWLHHLGGTLLAARGYFEAESLLRESFAIRENLEPQAWTTFSSQSLLGAALFRQGNAEEAEPLLLAGFKGLKARRAKIPPLEASRLFETADTLARLYAATEKPDLAAKWRKEAELLGRAGDVNPPVLPFASKQNDSRRHRGIDIPRSPGESAHQHFSKFLASVRPLLALVVERQTERRPAGVILGAATVLFQETPVMPGFRFVGLLTLAASAAAGPEAAAQYAFSLIDVPGATRTHAWDINSAGDIVGAFDDANGVTKAFLLSGGVFTVFNFPGATVTRANGINNVGQIVGEWTDSQGVDHGFLWEAGVITLIDVQGAGAMRTRLKDINDNGQIAGVYWDEAGIGHGCVVDRSGALLWNDFDVPGAIRTSAIGINEAGDVVGHYSEPNSVIKGFRKLRFGALEYPWGYPGTAIPGQGGANKVDAAGAVAGTYYDQYGRYHGYLFRDGNWSSLDVPSATDTNVQSFSGLNGTGILVGGCELNGRGYGYKTITPKFLAIDDVSTSGGDGLYQYDSAALASVPQPLYSFNNATRGMTRNASGTQYWVINSNRTVFVYDANFEPVDFWAAYGIPNGFQLEGIATAGNDVWIVDAKSDKVYKFTNGALASDGDKTASSSFALQNANKNPRDIVTNGTHFWVIDDAGSDKVFKYTMTGTFVSSFTLATSGATTPRAISIDPANPNDLWVADGGTKRVYKYANAANAANNSSQAAASSFPLASGNFNPQGLAIKP